MADISKITLPSGTTYDLKDAKARTQIEALRGQVTGQVHYVGVTTTALTNQSTTKPIQIGGANYTQVNGDIVIYGEEEFIWSDSDDKWHEFGSTGSLKGLAFKDSASGSMTPAGTVSVALNSASVTPMGSAGKLPSATMPKLSVGVSSETLTLGWTDGSFDAGSLPTAGNPINVATGVKSASFTGTQGTVTVK